MTADYMEVQAPHSQEVIAHFAMATEQDVQEAIASAQAAAKSMASLTAFQRAEILEHLSTLFLENREEAASIISLESAKPLKYAYAEIDRTIETYKFAAEEAKRLSGEMIPMDASKNGEGRFGYTIREPIGVIAAITPFNDPLNLVAHKVGPAIASGNAIIVKPATLTPLSALLLAEAFDQAGLPEKVLSVVTGSGSEIGDPLVTHPSIRMVSFTGGLETGEKIAKKACLKKLSMELGSNSPAIVLKDADVEEAVSSCVAGAFGAVGQNCLGVQRVFIETPLFDEFTHKFVQQTNTYKVGNKKDEATDMGPLISEKEAIRVEEWVNEALDAGATLLTGGKRDGAFYSPTVLTNVPTDAKIAKEEIFGPVVILFEIESLDEAIEQANHVNYGLQAGIFTKNIDLAFQAIKQLEVGGIMINDSSDYRIDGMPFGGVKGSGLGREGVKYTIQEMTEPKVVNFKIG